VIDESESDADLRLLLAPGSSLGGARPKASVRDKDGHLLIAKFPHKGDEINTVLWECVALTLAQDAGITVPKWRLEIVANRPVLLLRRFDREKEMRIPFLSAMSMLNAQDDEARSYMEIADQLSAHGSAKRRDSHMLWRRIVFSVLISNTDDHLRNHGFLYSGAQGWALSPAYDLNPVPIDIKPRVLTTNIDMDNNEASMQLAFEVADYFGLKPDDANEISREVATATSKWKKVAAKFDIARTEITRMASAFEHKYLKLAQK
jgi:serine/threonine-protein kinase HipA